MTGNMEDFELKRAGPGDLDALAPLVAAFHAEEGVSLAPAARRDALALVLSNPEIGGVWVMEREGAAIGYLILAFGFAVEFGGRDAFLDEIYIDPAFRGRGWGTFFLKRAAEEARALGLEAVHLEVHDDNEPAARLYASLGFARRPYRLMSMRFGAKP
ncbi:MAG: GNAT family N-acetyltransferase [Pseudomonadota bacterium]